MAGCYATATLASYRANLELLSLAIRPLSKPTFERRLTFTRRLTRQKVLHTDILVQVWPVNAASAADQSPTIPFLGCAVR